VGPRKGKEESVLEGVSTKRTHGPMNRFGGSQWGPMRTWERRRTGVRKGKGVTKRKERTTDGDRQKKVRKMGDFI